ncbi:hypothetical protein POREN0001_0492 [Porphyromonas endodontalis ATCC 35406]|uniref:Uncharacterized protein n=1 Tax=Porphyromonas endodontalis (strain ATCC 35406 / DSM 24491 / JCM 8526 / CCUG 16442 / BCRC 14492 / NCTC 13058 / HG 370) TaxID=553175 RepID=C3JC92_POREA|nr:hypothetical protein POREN0001_0492 [Porphyromonas endodontalis ATCC 35406]
MAMTEVTQKLKVFSLSSGILITLAGVGRGVLEIAKQV